MTTIRIACVVEGHGEVDAVPIVVRRIVKGIDPALTLWMPKPAIRIHRSKIVKPGEIENAVQLARLKMLGAGGVLVLIDADEECPATLGPSLLSRARAEHGDLPIAVVVAKNEFEAWFLAAATSLRGRQGLLENLNPPDYPEEITGAKEWLRSRMVDNRKYSPTIDQAELSRHFDLTMARQAPSFDKLYRDIYSLVSQLTK